MKPLVATVVTQICTDRLLSRDMSMRKSEQNLFMAALNSKGRRTVQLRKHLDDNTQRTGRTIHQNACFNSRLSIFPRNAALSSSGNSGGLSRTQWASIIVRPTGGWCLCGYRPWSSRPHQNAPGHWKDRRHAPRRRLSHQRDTRRAVLQTHRASLGQSCKIVQSQRSILAAGLASRYPVGKSSRLSHTCRSNELLEAK